MTESATAATHRGVSLRAERRLQGLTPAQADFADRIGERYFLLEERLASKRAFDPCIHDELCARCGKAGKTTIGGAWTPGARKPKDERVICVGCRTTWEPVTVSDLRPFGGRADPAPDGYLDDLQRRSVLRSVIEPRPRRMSEREWRQHLLAWRLYLDRRFGSMPLIAEQMHALRGTRDPRPWTEGHVRGMIERTRARVVKRLRKRSADGESAKLRALGIAPPRRTAR